MKTIVSTLALSLLFGGAVLAQTTFHYDPGTVQPGTTYDITITPVAPPPPPPPPPPPAGSLWFAANGSDSNPCTLAAPCLTLGKANQAQLAPGNTLNFRGGDTFFGHLDLTRTQVPAGNTNHVIVQSYGTGQAIIAGDRDGANASVNAGPKNYGILIDASGVTVQNLKITANGHYVQYGILVQNSVATAASSITIQNSDVDGFGLRGPIAAFADFGGQIVVSAFPIGTSGVCNPIDHVTIHGVIAHGNDGIQSSVDGGILANGCGVVTNLTWTSNEVYNIGGVTGLVNSFIVVIFNDGNVREHLIGRGWWCATSRTIHRTCKRSASCFCPPKPGC